MTTSSPPSAPTGWLGHLSHPGFLLTKLPYGLVFILTLFGAAYTSFSRNPLVGYWELLGLFVGAACIATGWNRAGTKEARMRLVWTQVLHWLAFLVAMNLLLLPNVQNMLNSDATGLAILLLLALGTFVAGVHILAWHVCVLGLIMALCVPAIAWLEESVLVVFLASIVMLAIAAAVLLNRRSAARRAI